MVIMHHHIYRRTDHNIIKYCISLAIACDGSLPASPVLEFQPGETEKHITVKFSNITRVELYLSAGEGAYLTPFPKTEIVTLDPGI